MSATPDATPSPTPTTPQAWFGPAAVRHSGPRSGPRIDVLGTEMTFKISERETRGAFAMSTLTVPPGAGVPLHSHPSWEAFYVLEGELSFLRTAEGATREVPARVDELVFVPHDAVHGFTNRSEAPARLLVLCGGGLEPFFLEAGTPIRAGGPPRTGPPSADEVERVLATARRHHIKFAR